VRTERMIATVWGLLSTYYAPVRGGARNDG
jgi:hypothetical protein